MIKTLKENIVMDNNFVKINNDTVEFPDKSTGFYYKISLSDRFPNYGVAGLVVTAKNEVILMDNYRYAHKEYAKETIKGFGIIDKTPIETFQVEMIEEIGFSSKNIQETFKLRGDNHDFFVHCFIAKNSIKTNKTSHENSEVIKSINKFTLKEALYLIDSGGITDPLTIVLIQNFILKLQN